MATFGLPDSVADGKPVEQWALVRLPEIYWEDSFIEGCGLASGLEPKHYAAGNGDLDGCDWNEFSKPGAYGDYERVGVIGLLRCCNGDAFTGLRS